MPSITLLWLIDHYNLTGQDSNTLSFVGNIWGAEAIWLICHTEMSCEEILHRRIETDKIDPYDREFINY